MIICVDFNQLRSLCCLLVAKLVQLELSPGAIAQAAGFVPSWFERMCQ